MASGLITCHFLIRGRSPWSILWLLIGILFYWTLFIILRFWLDFTGLIWFFGWTWTSLSIRIFLGRSRTSAAYDCRFLCILTGLGLLLLTIMQILKPMRHTQIHFAFLAFKIFQISQPCFASFSLAHFSPPSFRSSCYSHLLHLLFAITWFNMLIPYLFRSYSLLSFTFKTKCLTTLWA